MPQILCIDSKICMLDPINSEFRPNECMEQQKEPYTWKHSVWLWFEYSIVSIVKV